MFTDARMAGMKRSKNTIDIETIIWAIVGVGLVAGFPALMVYMYAALEVGA